MASFASLSSSSAAAASSGPGIDYRPDNTIIFTLARMNPPTPGHLYLIQRLIEEGINKGVDIVYVILSKTNDNDENPIPCSGKINVLGTPEDMAQTMIRSIKEEMKSRTGDERLKSYIDRIIVQPICVPDIKGATPFTPIIDIVKSKKLTSFSLIIFNVRLLNVFLKICSFILSLLIIKISSMYLE